MRFILAAIALCFAVPAAADDFEKRELTFQRLNAADAITSCIAFDRGFVEANPIIGRDATCGRVVAVKVGVGLLHWLIARELEERDPEAAKFFQIVSIGIQGSVVAWNVKVMF